MIRLILMLALLLGPAGAALADDSAGAAGTQPAPPQREIDTCKAAAAQIAPMLKATEDYARALATLGPADADMTMPSVLTGARRAALGNVFRDFKTLRPDLAQLQGDLEALTVIVNACQAGELTP